MHVTKKTFTNSTEVLDGNRYLDCTFEGCKLVYRGGELPHITSCQFNNCSWQFEEAAERTVSFMKHIYHGMGLGGAALIDSTFEAIRRPIN
jgi:hypothetical protein